jgi:hypothetical protein
MVNTIVSSEQVQEAHVGTDKQLHMITLVPGRPEILVYAVVDRELANIAMARLSLLSGLKDLVFD